MTAKVKQKKSMRPEEGFSWRTEHIGRLLLTAFDYFEYRLLQRIHAAGFTYIRYVHFNVLRNLAMAGNKIGDIAERAGITKAAMGQMVSDCVRLGIVDLTSDPNDARAKIVTYTAAGRELRGMLHQAVMDVEAEMRATVGDADMDALRRSLDKLCARAPREADRVRSRRKRPLPE